jgi:hypothetical protein
VPLFGASWQPSIADRDIATELLLRLEDRRVLYNPSDVEVPYHCVQSVIEIRHQLSDALVKAGGTGALADHIRALGAACRRFFDRIGRDERADYDAMRSPRHYLSWEFMDALGQLRGIFGVHIAMIAVRYDLPINGELADILPQNRAGIILIQDYRCCVEMVYAVDSVAHAFAEAILR